MIHIVVDRVGHVAVRGDALDRAAEAVHVVGGHQMQPAACRRGPAGRKILEIARARGVHVLNHLHDSTSAGVVLRVPQKPIRILRPDLPAARVVHAGSDIGGAWAVLGGRHHWQRDCLRDDLRRAGSIRVGVAGGLGAGRGRVRVGGARRGASDAAAATRLNEVRVGRLENRCPKLSPLDCRARHRAVSRARCRAGRRRPNEIARDLDQAA